MLKFLFKITDKAPDIIDIIGDMPNVKTQTLGGKVFWTTLIEKNGHKLQKNIFTGHCRILNELDERIAWGAEGAMWKKLNMLIS